MSALQPSHTNRIGEKIRRIWTPLGRLPERYTLIGGTAITLYCNHRESVDVDLTCSGASEHPRTIRQTIGAEIGKHKVFQRRNGIVIKFFATDTSPKIEVHGTDPWKDQEPKRQAENGLMVAAPSDLAARKLCAMVERDAARDGLDLQALYEAGADIGAAARSFANQVDASTMNRLAERLQHDAQGRWPDLHHHKAILELLESAARGQIEPPPTRIVFHEGSDSRIEVHREEIETGRTQVLTTTDTIREGLEWLASKDVIRDEDVPEMERQLETELSRERNRARGR